MKNKFECFMCVSLLIFTVFKSEKRGVDNIFNTTGQMEVF